MGLLDDTHLGTLLPENIAQGPAPSIWDSAKTAFQSSIHLDNLSVYQGDIADRFNAEMARTGVTQGQAETGVPAVANALHQLSGEEVPWYLSGYSSSRTNDMVALDEQVRAAGGKGLVELSQEVRKARRELEQQRAMDAQLAPSSLGSPTTWPRFFARLGGSMVGFSANPLQAATLGFGGFGSSVAKRIATEAAVVGATNAGIAAIGNTQRRILGEQQQSVTTAFVEGATMGLVFRGLAETGSALLNRWRPQETAPIQIPADLPHPDLVAARYAMDLHTAFQEANPYRNGAPGTKQFVADLNQITADLGLKTDTAVARFMEPMRIDADTGLINRTPEELAVMRDHPETMARLKAAQVELQTYHENRQLMLEHLDEQQRLPYLSEVLGVIGSKDAGRVADAEAVLSNKLYTDRIPALEARGGAVPELQAMQRAKEIIDQALAKYFPPRTVRETIPNKVADNGIVVEGGVPYRPPETVVTKELPGTQFGGKSWETRGILTREEMAKIFREYQAGATRKLQEHFEEYQRLAAEQATKAEHAAIVSRWNEALKLQDASKIWRAAHIPELGRLPMEEVGKMLDSAEGHVANAVEKAVETLTAKLEETTNELGKVEQVKVAHPDYVELPGGRKIPSDLPMRLLDENGVERVTTVGELAKELEADKSMLDSMRVCSL